ncbi:MAG: hypothetical protein ACOCX5_04195 [Chloroflexota bacterium]
MISARQLLKKTEIDQAAMVAAIQLVNDLEIDSARAEFTMFEAARAHAAADGRTLATIDDVRAVAPMALRQRRSEFMTNYFELQYEEDNQIRTVLDTIASDQV